MDIVKRNFFRLLRSGALGEYEQIEPMSDFKWKRLLALLKAQRVETIALKGLRNHQFDTVKFFPEWLLSSLSPLTPQSSFLPAKTPRLTNPFLNRRLNKIRRSERHAIDSSTETLELLDIIVGNVVSILNEGISLSGILELGHFLRTKGDRVDYVKIEDWLDRLHIRRMAELEGSILIAVFKFEADELPFIQKIVSEAYPLTLRSLRHAVTDSADEWHFRQRRNGFLRSNNRAQARNLRRSFRYITYSPIETTSNFLHNFTKSLAEIEE
ncbi:MAG: hypothetical protein IJM81_02465 [Prevotella sp.]|nr:hypothetical protein [Prevotella sp.]